MYLKYLELNGFKSFPDKTKLVFGRGLTAVVGPNGSGKSNISDAVRWVLGEQSNKALRGAKMEDVIFNGTAIRHASGYAEVKLCLDNTDRSLPIDKDEVFVTRKYNRSGESEYRICENVVRLKDVNELFMDTGLGRDGYSLIGQGKISEIVGSKPTQRREIFEEASGISKFRYRKEEAERNLEKADENLLRLRDNLSALEERVGPLLEQSEKAKKFLEYAGEKKNLEISVWMRTLHHLKENIRNQNSEIDDFQSAYDELDRQYNEYEEKINAFSDQIRNIDSDIESKRSAISENEGAASELNARSAVDQNNIEHCSSDILRLEGEITELSSYDSEGDAAIAEKQKDLESKKEISVKLSEKEKELNEKFEKLSKSKQSIIDERTALDEAVAKADAEIGHINVVLATADSDIVQYNERLSQLSLSTEGKQSLIDSLTEELRNATELLEAIDDKTEGLTNARGGIALKREMRQKQLDALMESRSKLQKDADQCNSRAHILEDLEKHMEGFGQSVKYVLDRASAGLLRGILDPVSKIISVDPKYSLAIETAAGNALQNIVVADEDAAKKAISLLKSEGKGRVTFLPLTSVKGKRIENDHFDSCDGYIGIASELLSYDKKFDGPIQSIFGRICVVEDLDAAISMARKYSYKFKIVTLDGQVVNAGGSFTGGSSVKSAGVLSRKQEITELLEKAKSSEKLLQNTESEYTKLREEIGRLDADLLATDSELRTAGEDRIRAEGEKKRIEMQISDAKAAGEEAENQKIILNKAIIDAEKRKTEFTGLLDKEFASKDEFAEKAADIDKRIADAQNLEDDARDSINALNLEKALAEKDIETAENALSQLIESRDNRLAKIESIKQQIEAAKDEKERLQKEVSELEDEKMRLSGTSEDIRNAITELYEKRKNFELHTTQEHEAQKDTVSKREAASVQLANSRSRLDDMQKDYDRIIGQLWDEYEMTYSMADEIAEEITEPAKAQKRLNELRSKIKALGPVNLSAIEEFKEVNERYNFMKSQIEDSEKARDDLRNLIHGLMSQMRTVFTDRFTQIAGNFAVVFRSLFGGGEGKLVLTDPDNVLESGIEIIAHPPGKIINNLSSLSGGEQTIVAIAIYFAILKVRPAPFCILDEIEAALDEANVDHCAEYMLTLTEDTQFISITHRRGTMEHADRLYGVTMQEEGVSKLLELSLDDVDKIEQ